MRPLVNVVAAKSWDLALDEQDILNSTIIKKRVYLGAPLPENLATAAKDISAARVQCRARAYFYYQIVSPFLCYFLVRTCFYHFYHFINIFLHYVSSI
jgi:hypothetical protein